MNLELDDQVALVTGGAAGIGAAIAIGLAREGCDVAIVDRETSSTATSAAIEALGRRVLALQADVRDPMQAEQAVAAAVAALGRLDILVCNAGITADSTLAKMSDEQWNDVVDVNLTGCFNYIRAVAGRFGEQGSGRIVTIASINGLRGKFGQGNYAASKAGIVALSKTAARELGRFNVNVNVVAPGMVMTSMARQLRQEIVDNAKKETLLARLATPEDCADVVVFLCSNRARHITGTVIRVDGGQSI